MKMSRNLKIEILKLLSEKSNMIFEQNSESIFDYLDEEYNHRCDYMCELIESYDYMVKVDNSFFDGNINKPAVIDLENYLNKSYLNNIRNEEIPLCDINRCRDCHDNKINIKCENDDYYFSICKDCGSNIPCIILNFKNDLLSVFNPKHIYLR